MKPFTNNLAGKHLKFQNPIYFIPKKFYPHCFVAITSWKYLNNIAPHPKSATLQYQIISLILNGHQSTENCIPISFLPLVQGQNHFMIAFWRTQTIYAGNTGHNNNIPPLKKRAGSRMPQLIYFIIDGSILLYIGICRGNIGLWLIIIIIADKIAYIIIWEKSFELTGQLGGQSLVVGNHQGRPLHLLNQLGYGKGFACTSSSQQYLSLLTIFNTGRQCFYSLRLIPHRLKGSYHMKRRSLVFIKFYIIQLRQHRQTSSKKISLRD